MAASREKRFATFPTFDDEQQNFVLELPSSKLSDLEVNSQSEITEEVAILENHDNNASAS